MYILFFALWIIFNGNFTLEIAVFGLVISAAVYAFCCKFMDFSIEKDLLMAKRILLFLRFVIILIREVILANIGMAKILMEKSEEELNPVIYGYKTKLKTKIGRVLLSNAITLTPGTITVSLINNTLLINAVDESLIFTEKDDFIFERILLDLEEGRISKGGRK